MEYQPQNFKQMARNFALGVGAAAGVALGINTNIETKVEEGQLFNPGYYSENFFFYEGDLRNPTKIKKVPTTHSREDYKDTTSHLILFGERVFNLGTKRKIIDPSMNINELDDLRYIEGALCGSDGSIRTKDGTVYEITNVGHDSVAYRPR